MLWFFFSELHFAAVWPFSQHCATLTLCRSVRCEHCCADLNGIVTSTRLNRSIFLARKKANNGVSSDLNAAGCWFDLRHRLHSPFGFARAHLCTQAGWDAAGSVRQVKLEAYDLDSVLFTECKLHGMQSCKHLARQNIFSNCC